MTNSHGDQGWVVRGRGSWLGVSLACSSVRLPEQRGSCIRSECGVFRARDEGLQEIWHDILAGPDHSLLLFVTLCAWFHLLKTFSPAERPHPAPCSRDIIITIRRGTSDIWPLSAWEEGVFRGEGARQAGVQGGFTRWKSSCSNSANSLPTWQLKVSTTSQVSVLTLCYSPLHGKIFFLYGIYSYYA